MNLRSSENLRIAEAKNVAPGINHKDLEKRIRSVNHYAGAIIQQTICKSCSRVVSEQRRDFVRYVKYQLRCDYCRSI